MENIDSAQNHTIERKILSENFFLAMRKLLIIISITKIIYHEQKKMNINSTNHNLILNFFKGDIEKTELWFWSKNPSLANTTPEEYSKMHGEDKLMYFIESQLSENSR